MESDSFKNLKNRINRYYKIDNHRHAFTILENDFPNEFEDILNLIIKHYMSQVFFSSIAK